jgi:hypothetical protein
MKNHSALELVVKDLIRNTILLDMQMKNHSAVECGKKRFM